MKKIVGLLIATMAIASLSLAADMPKADATAKVDAKKVVAPMKKHSSKKAKKVDAAPAAKVEAPAAK